MSEASKRRASGGGRRPPSGGRRRSSGKRASRGSDRAASGGKRRPGDHQRRPSDHNRHHNRRPAADGRPRQRTATPKSSRTTDDLYHKGRTSQVNEGMSLATLQGIAWRNGIPFGGLTKDALLQKIQNTSLAA